MKSLTQSREGFLRQCGPLREERKGAVGAETRTRIVHMDCAVVVGLGLNPAWVSPASAFIDFYWVFCTVVVFQLSMDQDMLWQALLPNPDDKYSLAPETELSSPLSQAAFAVCVYLLEVSLQVKGAKMDECPSGGHNKTRKQQLCDSEYCFSLS